MFKYRLLQGLWSDDRGQTDDFRFYLLRIGVMIVALYAAWRAWAFTIAPALHPNEPRKLPYWIPVIGHALGFFQDYNGALAHGKKYFGYTEEPYMITIPGQNLCLMSSPEHISKIYRNTVELTFDTFIRDLLSSLGASSSALEKWIPLRSAKDGITSVVNDPSPILADFNHVGERLCQRQLLPGEELDAVQKIFMDGIHESLVWEKIADNGTQMSISPVKPTSLLGWCQNVLLQSATCAFFGKRLLQIDPHLIENFLEFDDTSWKLHFGYPRFFSHNMYSAKDRIIKALTTYFNLSKEERLDASFLIKTFEVEMRGMEIEEKDIAALVMPVYWVINANAYKQCFWMMAHILNNPEVLSTLRDEVDPVVLEGTKGLELRLEQQCPYLKAIYHETLRLTASSSTIRGVQCTTHIGDKILSAGTNILIPYRLLHLNPKVFGNNAEDFEADRFLVRKDLHKDPSFRPFGGGKTYCPGSYLAQREVLTFVALALCRFDIVITAVKHSGNPPVRSLPSNMPRMDKKKLSLGIIDPVKGDDLIVDVKRRERSAS